MIWEPVIGLEVHAQLLTESKLFCGCRAGYGLKPNSATCPVCLGLPGALPVVNRRAVEMTVRLILALGGEVRQTCRFARKNYFYPDLPKGYQISQFDQPLGEGGAVTFEAETGRREVPLVRIHLEEDAGKLLHSEAGGSGFSRIDFNRCGVPLVEIVSQPALHSPHEAYLYLHRLKQIVEYLGICDGNMEEGSLRCDANISVRPQGEQTLGIRTEIKNLNSVRGIERALNSEMARQIEILNSGNQVEQQTLLYDDSDGTCYPLRSKEESEDYRYFPEPDLPALRLESDWIAAIREKLPELPQDKIDRLVNSYDIPRHDAKVLCSTRQLADYYEKTAARAGDAKLSSNWIITQVLRVLKEQKIEIDAFSIRPRRLGELLVEVGSGRLTGTLAKQVFETMLTDPRDPKTIMAAEHLEPVADEAELRQLAEQVLAENARQAHDYRNGKTRLLDFFVGQLMRVSGGRARPQEAARLLEELLEDKDG